MSLINEALKRTQNASYHPIAVVPTAAPSYRIQSGVEASGSKGTLLVTVLVAAIAVTGVVALVLRLTPRVQNLQSAFEPSTVVTPAVSKTKPSETPTSPVPAPVTAVKAEAPPAEPAPSAPTVNPKADEDQLVARVVEKIKADQAAVPAAPEPPKYVLQGITFANDGGEAMINGLNVHEGETIGDARVVAIERRTVKLDWDGHEIVLRLP